MRSKNSWISTSDFRLDKNQNSGSPPGDDMVPQIITWLWKLHAAPQATRILFLFILPPDFEDFQNFPNQTQNLQKRTALHNSLTSIADVVCPVGCVRFLPHFFLPLNIPLLCLHASLYDFCRLSMCRSSVTGWKQDSMIVYAATLHRKYKDKKVKCVTQRQ